jgi:hypothetical protein
MNDKTRFRESLKKRDFLRAAKQIKQAIDIIENDIPEVAKYLRDNIIFDKEECSIEYKRIALEIIRFLVV